MNMLLWLLVTGLVAFVGAQDHDGNGGEQGGSMTGNGDNNNNNNNDYSGGEGTDVSSVDSSDSITYGNGGNGNGVHNHGNGNGNSNNGNGGRGEGGDVIVETDTYTSVESESSEVSEYIEEHPWVGYVMVGVALIFFCFFCNLACCMCKEAFCRGKCKHCSCNRGQRKKRNNNMEQRRQAEYTELQQV